MHQKTKEIQSRYEGFLQTQCLWRGNRIMNLHQFKIETLFSSFNEIINEKLRLGKYIERFVSYQLNNENDIEILCENIQIQKDKITLGELDCILLKNNKPIHLEIIYKFYLYDESIGISEIENFIGPNRKDSLIEKLNKLKEKQLPLLYSKECESYLKSINLTSDSIEQRVYFKAQLFIPYTKKEVQLNTINQGCIVGYYITFKNLNLLNDCKFYIPNKKDWLVIPHQNVSWNMYDDSKILIEEFMEREYSPLCWVKKQNGEIFKIFITWWA
jgi:hypothetical protein